MTPFIIRLEKQDLDNLVTMLITSDSLTNMKSDFFSDDELINFTKNLMQQNADLLKLLKKIDFSASTDKLVVQQVSIHQKCKVYQEQLKKTLIHCTVHNSNSKNSIDSIELLGCNNCSLKTVD
ncbi:MAG: hypothetical protein JKX68_06485 [Flavobacteriales bacterium]|nr:hypothetical protein [Flavobacteriales bacterium]